MEPVQSSARLTFWEAASIIIGHGIGAGILSVPYLASRNSWWDILWIAAVAYLINLLLHFMIAELSYNNGGAQFIRCFEKELFVGRIGKILTWIAFALLGFSTIVNVSGFITGAAAALTAWLGLPELAAMLLFYIVSAAIVYLGLKVVGVCEKIAVFSMVGVVGILLAATLLSELSPLSTDSIAFTNLLALYSMVAFSLSAVMSTPQVVKGLQGDVKQIRRAIAAGTGLNLLLILVITFMTLLGAGRDISQNGALVDLAAHLGGWVSIIGYIFTLLALATSFWANTLNLRDIVDEQVHWGPRWSWLIASLPCLVIAFLRFTSFVGFTRLASAVQVLTGVGIIVAYHRSRRKAGASPICGRFGTLPFQILVIAGTLLSTVGALLPVK